MGGILMQDTALFFRIFHSLSCHFLFNAANWHRWQSFTHNQWWNKSL